MPARTAARNLFQQINEYMWQDFKNKTRYYEQIALTSFLKHAHFIRYDKLPQ